MRKLSTPAIFIYVILAVVVGSYLYYSQYYIPQKEDVLIRKAVRTLASIDKGMTEKEAFIKSFVDQRLAANALLDILAESETIVDIDSANGIQLILGNHVKPLRIIKGDWTEPFPQVVFKTGESGEKTYLEVKQINPRISILPEQESKKTVDLSLDNSSNSSASKTLSAAEEDFFSKPFSSWSNIIQSINKYQAQKVVSTEVEEEEKSTETTIDKNSTLVAQIGLDSLFEGVMDNEIFECVVVHAVDSSQIYFSNDHSLINPLTKFDLNKSDSLRSLFGVNILKVQVNAMPYVEFRRHVQVGDQTVYLSGFLSQVEYNQYLKEIDYFLLILVLLGTFTLIGSVPLIKVFVINEWERLRDKDVVFSAFSMLFVVFFGSLIVSTISQYNMVEHELEEDLEHYANRLSSNFINELDTIFEKATKFNFSDSSYWPDNSDFLFHEFFQTDHGAIKSIVLPYDSIGQNWQDGTRVQQFFEKFVRLDKRDYINKVIDGNAYHFSADEDGIYKGEFYLESVFSYSRGQTEAVVSFPNTCADSKGSVATTLINGISVDLKSLMWSLPPEGFGYALIDRDMNVMFSSKKAKNNFKNLGTDLVGMEFINQAITYGKPMEGHFDFGRDKFIGYATPISAIRTNETVLNKADGNPAFYLVTFANHDLIEWHTGVTSLLSALACFAVLMASIFLLIVQKLFKITRKDYRYFKNTSFYDTVFPERQDGITYLLLSLISIAGVVLGFVLFQYGLKALVRYGVVQVLLFGLLRPLLLSYSVSDSSRRLKRIYFFTISLILALAIFYSPGHQNETGDSTLSADQSILFVYSLIILLIGLWLKRELRKSKNRPWTFRETSYFQKLKYFLKSENAKKTYVFSIYAWLLAILVVPFLLISEKCQDIADNSFETMAGSVLQQRLANEETNLKEVYKPYDSIEKKVDQLHLDSAWQSFVSDELYFGSKIIEAKSPLHSAFFEPVFDLFADRYSYDPLYVPADGGEGYLNSIGFINKDNSKKSSRSTSKILVFLLTVVGLYALVRLFLNRILFNISKELQGGRVRSFNVIRALKKYKTFRQMEATPLRVFLVGIPRSRRTTILNSLGMERSDMGFIDFGRNTSFLDADYGLENIPAEIRDAKAIIIRFWFPEKISDIYLERLKKLTRYMEETEIYAKDSVILSDLTITQIEERWYMMKNAHDSQKESNEIMLYLKEWFRNYREFILPIERERFNDSRAISGQMGDNEAFDDYLNKSYYAPIYFSVWHSLSVKERFILFDLAEDGLLNARDNYVLMKLRRKGILNYNRDTYRMDLFHRSFKLFVRHGVSTEEIMEIEQFSKRNGSWGQIRLALLLLILAMLLFINTLMPNMFNALIGAIGVIASFSGAVSQISGTFKLPQFGKLFGGNKGATAG